MQKTIRGLKWLQLAPAIPHFGTPPPLLFITVLLVVSFSTTVVIVNTLAKRMGDEHLPDPFTAFSEVLPGQRLDTHKLEAEGFSCFFDTQPSPADITERCFQVLQTGAFSEISVTIWDGIVKWIDFAIRDHSLTVGDLSLRWGNPDIRMSGDWMDVSWPDHRITGSGQSPNGRFTYFLPISQIQLN